MFRPFTFNRCTSLAISVGLATFAKSQTVLSQMTAQFVKSNVPIWSNPTSGHNFGYTLLGPTWNLGDTTIGGIYDLSIPGIGDLGKTGLQATFGGTGALGLKVKPWYDGGAMNFTYNAGLTVLTSNALPSRGAPVTVSWLFRGLAGSGFTTSSPTFGLGLKANFLVTGHDSYQAWFLGKEIGSGQAFSPFTVGKSGDYEITSKISGSHDDGVIDLNANYLQQALALFSTLSSYGETNLLMDPVSFALSVPDVTTSAGSVNASDNSLSATSFGQFLNLDTDLLTILGMFDSETRDFSPTSSAETWLLRGPTLNLSWDIARAYADMNFGFDEAISLKPQPVVTVTVYNDFNGQTTVVPLNSSNATSATFNYPANGTVRIVPQLKMSFVIGNTFTWGITGDLGYTPIDFAFTGSVGSGSSTQTFDYTFDPANQLWNGPDSLAPIKQDSVGLDCGSTTLSSASLFAVDNYNLPTALTIAGSGTGSAVVNAFSTDPDKDYLTVGVLPKQGTQFFIGKGFSASAVLNGPGVTNRTLGLTSTANASGGTISIQIPSAQTLLQPGRFSISLNLQATTNDGKSHQSRYEIPVFSVHQAPMFAKQLYFASDLSKTINRCPIDGNPHTFWFSVTSGVYGDTDVLLDNGYSLPLINPAGKPLGSQPGPYTVAGFTVPAALARKLGAGPHSFEVRNLNIAPTPTGQFGSALVSSADPLPFVAATTTISDIYVSGKSQKVNPLVPNGSDQWITIRGGGFTTKTTARFGVAKGITLNGGELPLVFCEQAGSAGQRFQPRTWRPLSLQAWQAYRSRRFRLHLRCRPIR